MNETQLQRNRELIDNFLINRPMAKEYQIPDYESDKLFGYIYCIENIKNGKRYIGANYSRWTGTVKPFPRSQLSKRATNYLYEYNTVVNNKTTALKTVRPIIMAMVEDGFENFIMYPIAETTKNNHNDLEKYFITKYDTINNGYNVRPGEGSNINKVGTKLMAKDKKLRSTGIIAVHMNNKQLVISDSMKLFGDYLGSSKDMIKNSNRKGRPYKGWFIFYIDNEKRHYILHQNVLGDGLKVGDRHSEKSQLFYQELYNTVSLYLRDFCKTEYFSDFEILKPLEY